MEGAGERLIDAAQALLTGYDATQSRQWREEERAWRQQDLEWRRKEHQYADIDMKFMAEERQWRHVDIQQRHLENAHVLWCRYVERNKRDVEEKAEQLRAISALAAIIAGFAVVAFLEFEFDASETSPVLLPLYGFFFALTVALQLNAVVVCALVLSSILKAAKGYVSPEEEAEFMSRAVAFARSYRLGDRPPAPPRSFATHWVRRCESTWREALLLFTAGIFCNFAMLAVSAWIKFAASLATCLIISAVLLLAALLMAFFVARWTGHLLELDLPKEGAERMPLRALGLPFDWHLLPSRCPVSSGAAAAPGAGLGATSMALPSPSERAALEGQHAPAAGARPSLNGSLGSASVDSSTAAGGAAEQQVQQRHQRQSSWPV